MDKGRLPVGIARAHGSTTILSIDMDADIEGGVKLNRCTVARPSCSTRQQSATVEEIRE